MNNETYYILEYQSLIPNDYTLIKKYYDSFDAADIETRRLVSIGTKMVSIHIVDEIIH